ncbi:MAG: phosphatidylglycerophosphatase A [bacterium]
MRIIKHKKIVDPDAKPDLFSILFTSCFYVGYIPKASGTFGSLFALLFLFINGFQNPTVLLISIIVCFIIGIYTSKVMMKKFGDDPSVVVIDEVVGMWITILVFILLSMGNLSLFYMMVCFFCFRFFDIFKLQPAKYFDDRNTGYGVMMDDVIAGVYAGITTYLISMTKFNPF